MSDSGPPIPPANLEALKDLDVVISVITDWKAYHEGYVDGEGWGVDCSDPDPRPDYWIGWSDGFHGHPERAPAIPPPSNDTEG
jgi:hypothetical protein